MAEYRQVGYLAPAFVNYLALLGWAPGGNLEVVPPEELIQLFEVSQELIARQTHQAGAR